MDTPIQAAAEAWSGLRMGSLYKKDRDREMGKARDGVVAYLKARRAQLTDPQRSYYTEMATATSLLLAELEGE